ncbi:rod shape-determining protein MreC [Candidatus Parcubacteria bacterium]|nr:MAG: rod shape-determining protein MreC [Candidatus Parcubacteria bacterium]
MRSPPLAFRIIGLSLLVALFIYAAAGRFAESGRAWMVDAAAPAIAGLDRAATALGGWVGGSAAERIQGLERERTALLAEIAHRDALAQENVVLREIIALRSEGEEGAVPAHVIGFLRDGREEFILLDRGTADGIGIGDLVIGANRALGGSVEAVTAHTARVLLLTAASRATEVLLGGDGLPAVARGNNSRELTIDLVPQEALVRVGDLITASTRATGGRPGILVGQVREVRPSEHEIFKIVRAAHLFDPAGEYVIVLLAR